jgi:hypothetical protein
MEGGGCKAPLLDANTVTHAPMPLRAKRRAQDDVPGVTLITLEKAAQSTTAFRLWKQFF